MSRERQERRHADRLVSIGAVMRGAIARLAAALPDHVGASLSPEQVMLRTHGVQLGETPCDGCGVVYEYGPPAAPHYPFANGCVHCGRPLPRRCLTPGCMSVLQPSSHERVTRRGDRVVEWDEAPLYCGTCRTRQGQDDRLAIWRARVPKRLQGFATSGWSELPWHEDVTQRGAVKGWLSRFRRADPASRRATLYVCGPTGVGKSVALARLAHSLVVAETWASDLLWVREWDLITAHKDQYARGDDGEALAAEGRSLLRRATDVPLLVLDELFSLRGEPYTQAGAREIGRVLYERLEARRITLIASNEPPNGTLETVGQLTARTFDERIASRLAGGAEVVCASGDDLRRRVA